MVRCIRVPKSEGNPVRIRLKEEGKLNIDARIRAEEDHLLIPILSDSFEDYAGRWLERHPNDGRNSTTEWTR